MSMDGLMTAGGIQREVKGTVAKSVLSYVRRALGADAVEDVFEAAGRRLARDGLAQPASWTTTDDTIAIAEAAAVVCGDAEIGRRAGEELMRLQRERGTIDFVRATGSIAAALDLAANAGTKMSTGRTLEVIEVSSNYAVIKATYVDVADAHPFFCSHTAGYFGLVPEVFGCEGVITEPECSGRGDDHCIYRIAWSGADAAGAGSAAAEVEASRERMESFVARFEQLHLMATELAGEDELDGLLDRITERAGVAVDASRYLLAVRTDDSRDVNIHYRGFDGRDSAERFASRLLAADLTEQDGLLVAEVASATRSYGRLAAIYPRGSSITDMERRLLRAYARHAAAALDSVATLETARRDRDSAETLLSLAHALAEVGTSEDVASRLAAAVPAVAGCAKTAVWMWDQDAQSLSLAARFPDRDQAASVSILHAGQVPALADLVRDPVPRVVVLEGVDGVVRSIMEAEELDNCAIVPILARGHFLGVVTAGFEERLEPSVAADLLDRLRGLADQAATALDNGALLDAMRRQALHDSLTGLPNRTLLADRASRALAQARRSGESTSLLFVDLDRFKVVNDTLGHEMGDELIRQAAERLGGCVRTSDTTARIGGDEFVALLPDTDAVGAAVVAGMIVDVLDRPFNLAGQSVAVSCSVGIATAPDEETDYRSLLRRADAAMYEAKQQGGARFARQASASVTRL